MRNLFISISLFSLASICFPQKAGKLFLDSNRIKTGSVNASFIREMTLDNDVYKITDKTLTAEVYPGAHFKC